MELLDVTAHVTKDYPPVFLMTAVGDFLKPQAILLAEKLTACDVPFVCRLYGDADNRLEHVFHANIRTKDAALCNDEECAFFLGFVK